MFEEVGSVALVFVLQTAPLRPQPCPAPTTNPPLPMRPWTVSGRYELFIYSALHQCWCCVFARVCVWCELNTQKPRCARCLICQKNNNGFFSAPSWLLSGVSPPAALLQSRAFSGLWSALAVRSALLYCQVLHFKPSRVVTSAQSTHTSNQPVIWSVPPATVIQYDV